MLGADPRPRHRRAVRRQVFLPRRARHPPAAPRRQPADRHRRVVLGRPPDPRQDHRRGRVPRSSWRPIRRNTCPRSTRRRSAARWCRSTSAGRWARSAATLSQYPIKTRLSLTGTADRRARHRPRQAEGAARPRRGPAAIRQGPPDLLRRPGQDAGGLCLGLVRADHGRADGFLCRPVHGGGRQLRHPRQGQSRRRGARGLPANTAASISARSAARRRGSRRIASRRSRPSNIPSSAWRRSGASRSSISRPSSSSTTRATIFSPRCLSGSDRRHEGRLARMRGIAARRAGGGAAARRQGRLGRIRPPLCRARSSPPCAASRATPGEVEDLTQEVFLRLCKDDFRLLRSYDPARAGLSTWITIVARSTARDALRRHRPVVGADRRGARRAARGRPGRAGAQAQAARGAAVAAAARNPGACCTTAKWRSPRSPRALGIDPQTVRSTHHKAMLKLRAHFKAEAE